MRTLLAKWAMCACAVGATGCGGPRTKPARAPAPVSAPAHRAQLCTLRTIADGEGFPTWVTADKRRIFWLDHDPPQVVSASVDGSSRQVLGQLDSAFGPLIVAGGFVYFLGDKRKTIYRLPEAGGEAQSLVTDKQGLFTFTLDGGDLYWEAKLPTTETRTGILYHHQAHGRLMRKPLDGGAEVLVTETKGVSGAGLAVVNDRIVFGTTGSLDDQLRGELWSVARAGGEPRRVAGFDTPLANFAIADGAAFITVLTSPLRLPVRPGGDHLVRVPLDGGPATTIARATLLGPRVIASGRQVFFAERIPPAGTRLDKPLIVPAIHTDIKMTDPEGSRVVDVAKAQPGAAGMVLVGNDLVWANTGKLEQHDGQIVACRFDRAEP